MVKRLNRNLHILLIGSLMLLFTIVFCLLIHQNIKEKRKNFDSLLKQDGFHVSLFNGAKL